LGVEGWIGEGCVYADTINVTTFLGMIFDTQPYLVVKDETSLPWQHAKIPHLGDECGETLKQARANKEDHSPAASN
jgi:hypothetical protein